MRAPSGLLTLLVVRARAAPPPPLAASPPGTLAQLAGAGGCVSQQTPLGCAAARGLDDARAIALSPDGKSLYAVAATPASLTAFSVDARNGLLQQLNLSAGCLVSIDQAGCGTRAPSTARRRSSSRPTACTSTSPPPAAGSVTSFARQPNGSLVQLAWHRRLQHDDRDAGLRHRAVAGRRRRHRDLARRALRLRRRSLGRLDHRVRARCRDRPPPPLPGAAGCLRANRTGCTPDHGRRPPVGDRDRSRRRRRSTSPRRPAR